MTITVAAAVQLQVDAENRNRQDYPSDGYATTDPRELQLQDDIAVGFGATRELWAEQAADLEDWKLLYVEAKNMPLTLTLTRLDSIDTPGDSVVVQLLAGLPFLLGTRFDLTGLLRFNTVTVTGPASAEASVRFSITR